MSTGKPPSVEEATELADDDLIPARQWPKLHPDAWQGGAGKILRRVEKTTEADPAAVLVTLLAAVGVLLGEGPHLQVGNDRHPAIIWPLICGSTSAGAKGTSASVVTRLIRKADPTFDRVTSGLSSGEGLIEAVRDGNGDDPDAKGYDEGEDDKRLLVIESEFAAVIARMGRPGSTLGPVMRDAWDGKALRLMNRKDNKLRADTHHIGVVAHVTPLELVAKLETSDLAGGSINRFLMVLSRRARLLPAGGNMPDHVLDAAANIIIKAKDAMKAGRYERTSAADVWWFDNYAVLTRDRGEGRDGQATARAVPQVLRLALAYCLLDGATAVGVEHLKAAHAVWTYAELSAGWVFGVVGEEQATTVRTDLLKFIADGGVAGRTRDAIRRDHYSGNRSAAEITTLLRPLIESGQVEQEKEPTTGRPRTLFYLRGKRDIRDKPRDLQGLPELSDAESTRELRDNSPDEPVTALTRTTDAESFTPSPQVNGHKTFSELPRTGEVESSAPIDLFSLRPQKRTPR